MSCPPHLPSCVDWNLRIAMVPSFERFAVGEDSVTEAPAVDALAPSTERIGLERWR
jgi:hypothetical protein